MSGSRLLALPPRWAAGRLRDVWPALGWIGTPADGPEITDVLIEDGQPRSAALRAVAVERLRAAGNVRGAAVVAAMPADGDGRLDAAAVDRLYVAVHTEMQRMSEEFQHGARVRARLRPILAALARAGVPKPWRIVDVGCGIGFIVRWLAAHGGLGDGVELVGVDLDPVLVAEAGRLAAAEGLRCRFVHGDALALDPPPTVCISMGVLHHLRGAALAGLFRAQAAAGVRAFLHHEFRPSRLSGAGAWFWHLLRMRHRVAWHDGVLSARRSYDAAALLAAVAAGAPGHRAAVRHTRLRVLRIPTVLHALVGWDAALDLSPDAWPA